MNRRFKLIAVISLIATVFLIHQFKNFGFVSTKLISKIGHVEDIGLIEEDDAFLDSKVLPTKYIQYECNDPFKVCGGWADRLKGIMSTYALSIILNRTFLIQITQPCYLNTIIKPNRVNWNRQVDRSNMKQYRINDNGLLRGLFEHIDLDTYSKEMLDADLISFQTNVMFTNCAVKNARFKPILARLGFEDPKQFKVHYQMYKWYKRLFRLAPALEARHQDFRNLLKPTPKTFLICAQVRIGMKTPLLNEDGKFAEKDAPKKFWRFINETFVKKMDQYTEDPEDWKIFITTDHEWIKKEALQVFGNQRIVSNPGPTAHMDLDLRDMKENCGVIDNVILDFHLLQYCDAAIVSHSGYGLMGAWNRPVPNKNLYLYSKPNQDELKRVYWNRDNLEFIKVTDLDQDFYFL